jgi:hypothetical protein
MTVKRFIAIYTLDNQPDQKTMEVMAESEDEAKSLAFENLKACFSGRVFELKAITQDDKVVL